MVSARRGTFHARPQQTAVVVTTIAAQPRLGLVPRSEGVEAERVTVIVGPPCCLGVLELQAVDSPSAQERRDVPLGGPRSDHSGATLGEAVVHPDESGGHLCHRPEPNKGGI
jgi:hypothetical protein